MTPDGTTRHEVRLDVDTVGTTAVWLDLTPEEAAILVRVGERFDAVSHGEQRLTVRVDDGRINYTPWPTVKAVEQ